MNINVRQLFKEQFKWVNQQKQLILSLLADDADKNGLSLLAQICQNFMQHSQIVNQQKRKYLDLNFNAIQTKLAASNISIDILFECGFYKSDDGQKMLFGEPQQNTGKLMILNAVLGLVLAKHNKPNNNKEKQTETKSNNNNNVNEAMNSESFAFTVQQLVDEGFSMQEAQEALISSIAETNNTDVQVSDVKCICGDFLVKIKASEAYDGAQAMCSLCKTLLDPNDIILHCRDIINYVHLSGYDVCRICLNHYNHELVTFTMLQSMAVHNVTFLQSMASSTVQEEKMDDSSQLKFGLQADCKNIVQCEFLKRVHGILKNYDETDNINSIQNENVVKIVNDFNHILSYHNTNNDLSYIYDRFGGICEAEQCKIIKRHYRDRISTKSNDIFDDKHVAVHEILDKMHCHFRHQYDIGSKLTKQERDQINDIKQNNDDDIDMEATNLKSNVTLMKQCMMLQVKLRNFEGITKSNRYKTNNKFSSSLSKTKFNIESKQDDNDKNKPISYSHSFPFIYLDEAKNNEERCFDDMTYKDLYVPKKHSSLKEELTSNKIFCIPMIEWNTVIQKTGYYLETCNAKQCISRTQGVPLRNEHKLSLLHPMNAGYIDGQPILEKHLIALIVYTSFDELQYKFSETYRSIVDNESFASIKQRHSNFHHLAKYVKESVEVFGTYRGEEKIQKVYHGLNKEMVFEGMATVVYSPLSTSYEWDVAVQFSGNTGLILEMVPDGTLKYFQVEWLSDFSNESEILFIGGWGTMRIINIVNAQFGLQFDRYVQSLRMIDEMTLGIYFNPNPTEILKVTGPIPKPQKISKMIPTLCKTLIHHELNRNGYKQDKYKKYKDLDQYIDQLLHQICLSKQHLQINWNSMKTQTAAGSWWLYPGQGTVGYQFLFSIFCNEVYEGIDLNAFTALFPNLYKIEIHHLSTIDSQFLDHVLEFMKQNTESKIEIFSFIISKEFGYANSMEQYVSYQAKFRSIGFNYIDATMDGTTTNQSKQLVIAKVSPTVINLDPETGKHYFMF